jgi:ATP-binding cassette, subfamily B, bacterial
MPKRSIKFFKQPNAMDCGPACLRMIAYYYGKHYTMETLRKMSGYAKNGVSLYSISKTAEKIGFRTRGVRISYDLLQEAKLPCILFWNNNHFVVLLSVKGKKHQSFEIADPSKGIITYSKEEFLNSWFLSRDYENQLGIALILETTSQFDEQPGEKENSIGWGRVTSYLKDSKRQIAQVFITLIIVSLFQLIFPFLTQSIVDTGINTQNISFVMLILIAQLMLIFSRTIVEFIRGRLLLVISNKLNLSILSDFWIKLTRLPISYFDAYHFGDTIQRIGDHKKIQAFLTGTALQTVFSLFNFFTFSFVLISFNVQIFTVYIIGSTIYVLWVRVFLRIRRKLNYQSFHIAAKENNVTLQLIQGMQDIRLNNAEQPKRWEWENIQVSIFKLGFKSLTYGQWQNAGALLINQGKDAIITFLVAGLVIQGKMTLGEMLATQYIIGQLSSPIESLVSFVQNAQDAKISMERMNEIHQLEDEEPVDKHLLAYLPESRSIKIENLSFIYPGSANTPVLKDINMTIPHGKTTAIVGVSGSGKTTLLKILLKFYDHYQGDIKIGETNIKFISHQFWRKSCGAVMQDGFIFNDSIANNIAVGDELIDHEKLIKACAFANILDYVESLPNGLHTQLGADGTGLSQGQKQRILIARAIYKDPEYLLLDEATNSLDANNERSIVEKMQESFHGRTVIVVAHRLSTVMHADNIVVLDKGVIKEQGTHKQLSHLKGHYYELVKNQLELGN